MPSQNTKDSYQRLCIMELPVCDEEEEERSLLIDESEEANVNFPNNKRERKEGPEIDFFA